MMDNTKLKSYILKGEQKGNFLSITSKTKDFSFDEEYNQIFIKENNSYTLEYFTTENLDYDKIRVFPHDFQEHMSCIKDEIIKIIIPIRFKDYVGKSELKMYHEEQEIFSINIEIQSSKIDYEKDYRKMIEELYEHKHSLIYSYNSPVFENYQIEEKKEHNIFHYYMYMEYLFADENLPRTYDYIMNNLHKILKTYKEKVPIYNAVNIDFNDIISYVSSSGNIIDTKRFENLPDYIPLYVNDIKHEKSINNLENQFFKYFLEYIKQIIEQIRPLFKGYPNERLEIFHKKITQYLSDKKLQEIEKLEYIPYNSQVLQKSEGYKDILKYYLKIDNTFNLLWDSEYQIIKGNEKKIYELYERWCYFILLECLKNITNKDIDRKYIFKKYNKLIDIKAGKNTKIKFEYSNEYDIPVSITLWYNRSFQREITSYSVTLRPDYTLKLKIGNQTKFIHFDAKYKTQIIYKDDKDKEKSFNNADIAKMHAYKDAITNSLGAYVLYPGTEKEKIFKEKHYENETFKSEYRGVGAIPLVPGKEKNKETLQTFIKNYIDDEIKRSLSYNH